MAELADRIAKIIEWHVIHTDEAGEPDCQAAADDIVRLFATPSEPTLPERAKAIHDRAFPRALAAYRKLMST